ncbi:hypothetical protein [Rufibacter soli]
MSKQIIPMEVVQATDLSQFKTADGRRRLNMHYFLRMDPGAEYAWQYRMVDKLIDPASLQEWIDQGRVFIMASDAQVREMA